MHLYRAEKTVRIQLWGYYTKQQPISEGVFFRLLPDSGENRKGRFVPERRIMPLPACRFQCRNIIPEQQQPWRNG
jgi:hypothetical protein